MKTVRVTMPDETHKALFEASKKAGLPGIASYLLMQAGELTDDAQAADIKKRAIQKVRKVLPGKQFRLRELFDQEEWNNFSKGSRIIGGRYFNSAVQLKEVDGVVASAKQSGNHQFYIRTLS